MVLLSAGSGNNNKQFRNKLSNTPSTAYKIFTLTHPNTSVVIIAEDLYSILIKLLRLSSYHFNNLGKISLVGEDPNCGEYSVSRIWLYDLLHAL